jgi:hypothetical protein
MGLVLALLLAGVCTALPLPVSDLRCALGLFQGGLRVRGELPDVGNQIPHVLGREHCTPGRHGG